ncbi:hypothetical protein D3C77_653820 [compost metagenome]
MASRILVPVCSISCCSGENSSVIRSSTRSLAFSAAMAAGLPVSGVAPRYASASRLMDFSALTGGRSSRLTRAPRSVAAAIAQRNVCGCVSAPVSTVTICPASSRDSVSTCFQA